MGFLDYDGLISFWEKIKTVLTGKQDVMHFDNSLNVNNGTMGVTTPVKGITQAEYDALSEVEKNSGLYVITDANISLNDRGDVYSTEETRIGTWIDGKSVYRKCYILTTPSSSEHTNIVNLSSLSIDTVVALSGQIKEATHGTYYPINAWNSKSFTWGTTLFVYNYNLRMGVVNAALMNRPMYVVLEYTKTTDAMPTSQTTLLTSQVPPPNKVTLNTSTSPITVTLPSTAVTASSSASSAFIHFTPASASSTEFKL